MSKTVVPHPEQVPSLLKEVTDKSLQHYDSIVIDKPMSDITGPSTLPITLINNMGVLPYDDELELSV